MCQIIGHITNLVNDRDRNKKKIQISRRRNKEKIIRDKKWNSNIYHRSLIYLNLNYIYPQLFHITKQYDEISWIQLFVSIIKSCEELFSPFSNFPHVGYATFMAILLARPRWVSSFVSIKGANFQFRCTLSSQEYKPFRTCYSGIMLMA